MADLTLGDILDEIKDRRIPKYNIWDVRRQRWRYVSHVSESYARNYMKFVRKWKPLFAGKQRFYFCRIKPDVLAKRQ